MECDVRLKGNIKRMNKGKATTNYKRNTGKLLNIKGLTFNKPPCKLPVKYNKPRIMLTSDHSTH